VIRVILPAHLRALAYENYRSHRSNRDRSCLFYRRDQRISHSQAFTVGMLALVISAALIFNIFVSHKLAAKTTTRS